MIVVVDVVVLVVVVLVVVVVRFLIVEVLIVALSLRQCRGGSYLGVSCWVVLVVKQSDVLSGKQNQLPIEPRHMPFLSP